MSSKNSARGLLHDQWSSKFAFIIAATGAAVGLGNVWRFPYMAGEHGGSAFVLVYLLCVLLLGLPILVAEILIGRRGRRNSVDSLRFLAEESHSSKSWGWLGWWGAIALLLILSFYSVVAGWSIAYLFQSIKGTFYHASPEQIQFIWKNFLASPWQLLGWHTLFMALTIWVIVMGVQKGLEKATKIMMPSLYIILLVLVIYAAVTGDFNRAFHYLFDFKLSAITPNVVISAMGHAFFTLALGAGAMLTYGAYMPPRVNIPIAVLVVAGLDVLVAILSGLAIFPIVFAHNLPAGEGPGLMFVTLPISFAHISGGSLIGGLFFLLLLFAAWTASINLTEPMVVILMNRLKMTRTQAALVVGFCAWFLGIGSVLSFNLWQNIKLWNFNIFDIATGLPMDIFLPLGGLGFAIFAGWVMRKGFTQEELPKGIYPLWRFLIRYVAPIGILVIFITSIWH